MNETELEDLLHNVTRDDPCPQKTLDTLWENGKLEIPLYSVIFLLAVVGNILVILTLAKNSRMRTNTNVFLLNLAVSDLVLAVLCMPFTLVGTLLKDFVFGEFTCKLVPYLQGKFLLSHETFHKNIFLSLSKPIPKDPYTIEFESKNYL